MQNRHPYITINGDKEWKEAVGDENYVVKFVSKAEEESYEKRDALLNSQIKDVIRQHLGEDTTTTVFVDDDWWPSQCRYVILATSVLSHELIEKLRSLLTGDFQRWRVQVIVYGDIYRGSTEVGGLMVYRDKVLVERTILNAVDLTKQASREAH